MEPKYVLKFKLVLLWICHADVDDTWYSSSLWANPITEALRYGTRCQGITQFYLPLASLSTNGMNHTWLCLPSWSWSSFTDPKGTRDWVGLGTTMVSKQYAQGRDGNHSFSCSDRRPSPGKWKCSEPWASNSRPLGPKATTLTTEPPSKQRERKKVH